MSNDASETDFQKSARSPRIGWIGAIEVAVGAIFTLIIFYFHGVFVTHAGGLWRDEANTIGLATLPTFGEVCSHLEFDSFPLLWPLFIRLLGGLGLTSDPVLRGVGLVIGVALVATLWLIARSFRTGPPMVSLFLLALSPAVIIWGDCVRAHGCGLVTGLAAYAFIWRLVEKRCRGTTIAAVVAALIAAQTSYYNCIVVLAGCIGGFAVCLRRRQFEVGCFVLASGLPAALSMIPYIPVFHRAADWNVLIQIPEYDLPVFWFRLSEALNDAGLWVIWLWMAFLAGVAVLSIAALSSLPDWKVSRERQEVILFNLVALFIGVLAYYGFLKNLHYITQKWYYLTLLGFVAVVVDAIVGASCINLGAHVVRLAIAVAAFGFLLRGPLHAIPFRLTNVDLIAEKIRSVARENDLVVVDPWFGGITYARYGSPSVPWSTLPPMDFHRYHRYDLIKQMMQDQDQADPLRPLLSRMGDTLRRKGKIYMVGGIRMLPANSRPILLPPAPTANYGWNSDIYRDAWSLQVGYFLQIHAIHGDPIGINTEGIPINIYEDLPLVVIQGWKE